MASINLIHTFQNYNNNYHHQNHLVKKNIDFIINYYHLYLYLTYYKLIYINMCEKFKPLLL